MQNIRYCYINKLLKIRRYFHRNIQLNNKLIENKLTFSYECEKNIYTSENSMKIEFLFRVFMLFKLRGKDQCQTHIRNKIIWKKKMKKNRERYGYQFICTHKYDFDRTIICNILMTEYHVIRDCIEIVRESRENRS